MGKKLLSILLTLALCVSMLPAAYAGDVEIVEEPRCSFPVRCVVHSVRCHARTVERRSQP